MRFSTRGAIPIIWTSSETGHSIREHQLFLGKFFRTIDAKNRFTVPPPFQAELTSGAYMTQGFDRNLQILTADAFKEIYRRATAFSIADPIARQLLRLILGTAVKLQGERLTTISIPEDLKEFAALKADVVLVGQGDYIEIWAPELWNAQETQLRDAEANSSRFAALSVATR
jgi:MraZ protein